MPPSTSIVGLGMTTLDDDKGGVPYAQLDGAYWLDSTLLNRDDCEWCVQLVQAEDTIRLEEFPVHSQPQESGSTPTKSPRGGTVSRLPAKRSLMELGAAATVVYALMLIIVGGPAEQLSEPGVRIPLSPRMLQIHHREKPEWLQRSLPVHGSELSLPSYDA